MKIIRLILLTIIGLGIGLWAKDNIHIFTQNRVDAAGSLTFNLGVANGDPLFTFNNIAPGFSDAKTISATNGDTVSRQVGVKGIKTSGQKNLEAVMGIVISENGTDIYGGNSSTGAKTLQQFFTESQSINGVQLTSINPNQSANYTFTVKFLESAGNEYQAATLTFDLLFGIVTEIPLSCEGIRFSKVIFGTAGNDNLRGTVANDLIIGLEGSDKIDGGVGNDCIVGGNNSSRLNGGVGNDVIVAQDGNDVIDSGAGEDIVIAGDGNDLIQAGQGKDTVFAGDGNDTVNAGEGVDTVYGEAGIDSMRGGQGPDILDGGDNNDTAIGEEGRDSCGAETKVSCEVNL